VKTLGTIVTVIAGAVALVAVIVGARSVPDVRRYLKMRSM
jgi:hypothetical protein